MKKKNQAGQCHKTAAVTLWHDKSPLGDLYRRHRGKSGGSGAIVASANKLSRIIYIMPRDKVEYDPNKLTGGQQNYKEQRIRQLEKQLTKPKGVA